MQPDNSALNVLVTGAGGNLGRKLLEHFVAADWCRSVVGVSLTFGPDAIPSHDKLRLVWADLSDSGDARWRAAFEGVDAVVHLAAQHPYPDASWPDSAASVDITLNVIEGARAVGARRVVFASSNYVMGGYKEAGLKAGELTPDLPPRPGTRFGGAGDDQNGAPYATAKLMGERICAAGARASAGALSTVALRIGWCRPGDNRPEEITLEALPGAKLEAAPDADSLRDLRWLRDMWLSNRDLVQLIERAIRADASRWPAPAIVVNGNSANAGMPWSLEGARQWLGYAPRDNLYSVVKA